MHCLHPTGVCIPPIHKPPFPTSIPPFSTSRLHSQLEEDHRLRLRSLLVVDWQQIAIAVNQICERTPTVFYVTPCTYRGWWFELCHFCVKIPTVFYVNARMRRGWLQNCATWRLIVGEGKIQSMCQKLRSFIRRHYFVFYLDILLFLDSIILVLMSNFFITVKLTTGYDTQF